MSKEKAGISRKDYEMNLLQNLKYLQSRQQEIIESQKKLKELLGVGGLELP